MKPFRAASTYVRIGAVILITSLCLVLGACSSGPRQAAVDTPAIQVQLAPSAAPAQTPQAKPPTGQSSQNPQPSTTQSPPEVKSQTVVTTAPTEGATTAPDPAPLIVYVTRTGEKYHRAGCRYLRQSKIEITLREATTRGFGPCSVCRPPT